MLANPNYFFSMIHSIRYNAPNLQLIATYMYVSFDFELSTSVQSHSKHLHGAHLQ